MLIWVGSWGGIFESQFIAKIREQKTNKVSFKKPQRNRELSPKIQKTILKSRCQAID